ncbi:MAG: alanine--glyoxylate aminotransferase family protein [Planctomycetota bacterium]|nr:alanine--glyoxylate aminotransferase family protein [Planctomycetota bacterium]
MPQNAKYRLMTPGPTPVPDEVLEVLSRPVRYHRSDEARGILRQAIEGLRHVFQTNQEVVLLTSSGTGAMEAAVVNTLTAGSTALVIESGKFSQRWSSLCQSVNARIHTLEVPWGKHADPQELTETLRKHPEIEVVFATLCETSTGVVHDIKTLAQVVGETSALFVVDGISGVGADRCYMDSWGIDLLVAGSQKALMMPPGLAFVAVSSKAWERIQQNPARGYYFDLCRYRDKLSIPDTPFTPAHTLIAGLTSCLSRIQQQGGGIEHVWERTEQLASACRSGIEAMGLKLFASRPSAGVTAVQVPEQIDGIALLARLRDRFNLVPAGGQEQLRGRIVRIAHMGYTDALDVVTALAGLELVLYELRYPLSLGEGGQAALQVFANQADVQGRE